MPAGCALTASAKALGQLGEGNKRMVTYEGGASSANRALAVIASSAVSDGDRPPSSGPGGMLV